MTYVIEKKVNSTSFQE